MLMSCCALRSKCYARYVPRAVSVRRIVRVPGACEACEDGEDVLSTPIRNGTMLRGVPQSMRR